MKVLSLLQPWASLVVLGHKKIETRSWNTQYRGQILIHASKKKLNFKDKNIFPEEFIKHYHMLFAKNGLPPFDELPLGAIIGQVDLLQTNTTDHISELMKDQINIFNEEFLKGKKAQEHAFGDYTPGRYGWLLDNPIVFKNPIPAKGNLGLWNYKSCECTHTQACSTCAEIKDIDWSIIEPAFKK